MAKKIVAFALGLFLSAGVCADVAHAAGEAVSTMVAVKGKTFIERDSAERPAKVKDDVLLVDTVATREAAKAKMLFIDDSVLTLGEKTKVVVKEYVYSKERGGTSIFNLLDGKMKAVVGKAKFEVHTPTAVAAARGTVFLIETGLRNGVPFTDVISLEGEVVVTPVAGPGARGGGPGARDSGKPDGASAGGVGEVVLTPGNFVTVTPGDAAFAPGGGVAVGSRRLPRGDGIGFLRDAGPVRRGDFRLHPPWAAVAPPLRAVRPLLPRFRSAVTRQP